MKIPVDFEVAFGSEHVIPIQLVRINVGVWPNPRLMLYPDGRIRLHVNQRDIDSGSVVIEGLKEEPK